MSILVATSLTGGIFPPVELDDQFFAAKPATIQRLSRFCTPVGKDAPAPIPDPENALDHLACYDIGRDRVPNIQVALEDQFIAGQTGGPITFTAEFERRFCEPANKLVVFPR